MNDFSFKEVSLCTVCLWVEQVVSMVISEKLIIEIFVTAEWNELQPWFKFVCEYPLYVKHQLDMYLEI